MPRLCASVGCSPLLLRRRLLSLSLLRQYQRNISSFGFSGAGFLTCYHFGVAKCLVDQGVIPAEGTIWTAAAATAADPPPCRLVGVSAGALAASTLAFGVDPAEGLDVTIQVAKQTKASGRASIPLVNAVEAHMARQIQRRVEVWKNASHRNNKESMFFDALNRHGLLRIGLTDRRSLRDMKHAACHVDTFHSGHDVVAACVHSMYIPGWTAPALWETAGSTMARANHQLKGMLRKQQVVRTFFKTPASSDDEDEAFAASGEAGRGRRNQPRALLNDLSCWDGGFANPFPVFDQDTVVVTPWAMDCANATISPRLAAPPETASPRVRFPTVLGDAMVHLTGQNMRNLASFALLLGRGEGGLQDMFEQKYQEGYDHALLFLRRQRQKQQNG